jgi:hypothetical protein
MPLVSWSEPWRSRRSLPRPWPLLPQLCPSPPRSNPVPPRPHPAPPPPWVYLSQLHGLRRQSRQGADRSRLDRLRPGPVACVLALVVSDLHQACSVLGHVCTSLHHNRARTRRFRPGNCHTEAKLPVPGSKLAASAAECTCSGAGLVTDAAEQARNAAEQVFDSLRDPARRAMKRPRAFLDSSACDCICWTGAITAPSRRDPCSSGGQSKLLESTRSSLSRLAALRSHRYSIMQSDHVNRPSVALVGSTRSDAVSMR